MWKATKMEERQKRQKGKKEKKEKGGTVKSQSGSSATFRPAASTESHTGRRCIT